MQRMQKHTFDALEDGLCNLLYVQQTESKVLISPESVDARGRYIQGP